MPELTIEENCDNSPRKQVLSDFYVAFITERDEEAIRSMLTDDAQLVIVGDQTFDGKQNIVDSMGFPR